MKSWPTTSFERYLLADDRHRYSLGRGMTFPLAFQLAGRLDPRAWRQAVVTALARHPLLASRLVGVGKRLRWEPSNRLAAVCDSAAAAFHAHPAGRVNPVTGPPFAWANVQRECSWEQYFQFHHAAVDGIGAIQFAGDCFAAYQGIVSADAAVRLHELPGDLLDQRGELVKLERPAGFDAAGRLNLSEEIRRFFLRRVQPVQPPMLPHSSRSESGQHAESPPGEATCCWFAQKFSDLHQVEIDLPTSEAIRRAATAAQVTVNDLAMQALFMTLYEFNQRHAGWYRLTMPANLREREQRRMPACNRIGYAFVDRYLNTETNRSQMLLDLAAENSTIRSQYLGSEFLGVLNTIAKVPGLMRLATSRHLLATTAVFSNIGDPTRRFHWRYRNRSESTDSGDLQITGFAGAPPIRPKTPASFLLHQLAGRIHLNVLINRDALARDQAMLLLHLWRERMTARMHVSTIE